MGLSQNDSRWKLKKINGTTSNIGNFGCLLTGVTWILNKAGYVITPDELATKKELFDGDMWVGWDKLQSLFPNVQYVWGEKCSATPAPIDKIISELKDGYYPIVMLDYSPSVKGLQSHYVVVIDSDAEGNLKIMDEWDGAEVWLDSRYGTQDEKYKILKVDVYHFTKPPVADDKWDNIKKFIQEKNATEGDVRSAFGALSDAESLLRKISDLQSSLTTSQTKINEKDKIISDTQNELDGANTIIHTKNGYREKLAVMLNCTPDWDEIVRNVAVCIGNEDKYTGAELEIKNLKGRMEEMVKEKVDTLTYDLNFKLTKANSEIITLSGKNNQLTQQVKDLKSIIDNGRQTLLDKIKSLLRIK